MKKISLVVFMVLAALLMGCSSVKAPKANLADHDEDHNIPAIDQMIISMKIIWLICMPQLKIAGVKLL